MLIGFECDFKTAFALTYAYCFLEGVSFHALILHSQPVSSSVQTRILEEIICHSACLDNWNISSLLGVSEKSPKTEKYFKYSMPNPLNYVKPADPVDMYFVCQSCFGPTSKVYFRKIKYFLHLIIILVSQCKDKDDSKRPKPKKYFKYSMHNPLNYVEPQNPDYFCSKKSSPDGYPLCTFPQDIRSLSFWGKNTFF